MLKLTSSDIKVILNSEDITSEEKNIIKKSKSFLGLFGGELDDKKNPELAKKVQDIINPDINKIMNEVKENNEINPPKMYQEHENKKSNETLNKEINTFSNKIPEDEKPGKTEEVKEVPSDEVSEKEVITEEPIKEKPKMVFVAPSGAKTEIKTEEEKAEEERISKLDAATIKAPNIEQVSPPKAAIDLEKIEVEAPKEIKKPEIEQVSPPKNNLLSDEKELTETENSEISNEENDNDFIGHDTPNELYTTKENSELDFKVKTLKVEDEQTKKNAELNTKEIKEEEKETEVILDEPLIPHTFSFGNTKEAANNNEKTETKEELVIEEPNFDEENEKLFRKIRRESKRLSNLNAPQKVHTINLLKDTLSVIKVNLSLEIDLEERNITIKTLKEVEEEIDMLSHI